MKSHMSTIVFTTQALKSFVSLVKSRISNTRQLERKDLLPSAVALGGKVDRVVSFVSDTHPQLGSVMESAARDFSYSLAHIFIGNHVNRMMEVLIKSNNY